MTQWCWAAAVKKMIDHNISGTGFTSNLPTTPVKLEDECLDSGIFHVYNNGTLDDDSDDVYFCGENYDGYPTVDGGQYFIVCTKDANGGNVGGDKDDIKRAINAATSATGNRCTTKIGDTAISETLNSVLSSGKYVVALTRKKSNGADAHAIVITAYDGTKYTYWNPYTNAGATFRSSEIFDSITMSFNDHTNDDTCVYAILYFS